MNSTSFRYPRLVLFALFFFSAGAFRVSPQAIPYARSFSQPRLEVEQALKDLQAYSGQKLPTLEGFVAAGDKPLDRYERGFYQFSIELVPGDVIYTGTPGSTKKMKPGDPVALQVERDGKLRFISFELP